MGILDDALNLQDAKRSQRLSKEAQKSKIENRKIKEGTYRGIDLIDGTAKIQLDGQTTATSGYKLITNAPLGDGDRVSIRPNGVGMPRADAKNVAPKKEVIVENFLSAILRILSFSLAVNAPSAANSSLFVAVGDLMEYRYSKNIKFKEKSKFNVNKNTINPIFQGVDSYSLNFGASKNLVQINREILVSANNNLEGRFEVAFPLKIFSRVFEDIPAGLYDFANFNTCPIEVEMAFNDVVMQYPITRGFFTVPVIRIVKTADQIQLTGSALLPVIDAKEHTFSFRFRKRVTSGEPLPWFSLG